MPKYSTFDNTTIITGSQQQFPPGWVVSQIARDNPGLSTDPHINDVVLYLKNSKTDISNKAHTITDTNNNVSTVGQGHAVSNSLTFANSTLETPLDSSLNLGQEFTIEMFVKSNGRQARDAALMCTIAGNWPSNSRGADYTWQIGFSYSQRIYFVWNISRYRSYRIEARAPEGSWFHLAITRDNTNTVRMFINGKRVAQNSTNIDFSLHENSSSILRIGRNRGNNRHFRGEMENIRVTNNVCRYTENFDLDTDLFAPENALLLQDTNQDQSPNGYSLTFNGNASLTTNSKFGSYAFSVGGGTTGGNNSIIVTKDFNIGRGDYTLETWIYFEQDPTGKHLSIIRPSSASYSASDGPQMFIDSSGRIAVGGSWVNYGSTIPLLWEANRWYHIAACRWSGHYLRIYRDGEVVTPKYSRWGVGFDFTSYNSQVIPISIGYPTYSNDTPFIFDDLRITKAARYTGKEGFNIPVVTFPSQILDPFPT